MNKFVKKYGHIDNVARSGSELIITGWAVSENGELPIEFVVISGSTNFVTYNAAAIHRPDVSKHLKMNVDGCGFRLIVNSDRLDPVFSVEAKFKSNPAECLLIVPPSVRSELSYLLENPSATKPKEVQYKKPIQTVFGAGVVNVVNFVAIHGFPGSGKSTLGKALSKSGDVVCIHTDSIVISKMAENFPNKSEYLSKSATLEEHFNVAKFVDSPFFDMNMFIEYLESEISNAISENNGIRLVVIDGYALKHSKYLFEAMEITDERIMVLKTNELNGKFTADSFNVTNGNIDGLVYNIDSHFKKGGLAASLSRSTYQDLSSLFYGIGIDTQSALTDSETYKKFNASHLSDLLSRNSRFLDIGCNAGFYCFKAAQVTGDAVVGIDMNKHWLEIGSQVNNSIIKKDNIRFLNADAFEFLSVKSSEFDVIHCSSTYHYFRERQTDFIRSAREALSLDGFLVLEVELSDEITDQPHTVYRARGVDPSPCAFPNRMLFIEQVSEYFDVVAEYKSVFQKGSFYDRTYFHLRAK